MAATPAVRIAEGVYRIPTAPFDFVNSYAFVEDDDQVVLVDTGTRSAPDRLLAGLASLGRHPGDVRKVLLTHAHADHAGGAAEVLSRTGAPLAAHEADAPHLEAGRAPLQDPSTRLGRLMRRLPSRFPAVEVAERFSDGAVLDVAGGLRVVHTPGHTPGHVSLLHERTGVLITGDSIWNVRRLRWPVLAFCSDVRLTQRTADALGELEYDVAAFTHGPEVADSAREQVRRFLREAERLR